MSFQEMIALNSREFIDRSSGVVPNLMGLRRSDMLTIEGMEELGEFTVVSLSLVVSKTEGLSPVFLRTVEYELSGSDSERYLLTFLAEMPKFGNLLKLQDQSFESDRRSYSDQESFAYIDFNWKWSGLASVVSQVEDPRGNIFVPQDESRKYGARSFMFHPRLMSGEKTGDMVLARNQLGFDPTERENGGIPIEIWRGPRVLISSISKGEVVTAQV